MFRYTLFHKHCKVFYGLFGVGYTFDWLVWIFLKAVNLWILFSLFSPLQCKELKKKKLGCFSCSFLEIQSFWILLIALACCCFTCPLVLWVSWQLAVDLELCCLGQPLPATCDYWALEMWPIQTKMCCICKVHTRFQRLGMKKEWKLFHYFILVIYWIYIPPIFYMEMIIFWIYWVK